jgi:Lrp/AsnC family transcriptional regulator, regulator for asnA, asnC and gidA
MITETDLKLISALDANGRASYAELSRSLSIGISTVSKKVKSLLYDGVISIQAIPNPNKLGQTAHALVALRTSVNKLEDVCKRLEVHQSIDLLAAIFGRFNLVASVQFTNWDDLHGFISSEIAAINSITDMEVFFAKENKKRFYHILGTKDNEKSTLKIDGIDRQIIDALCVDGRSSVSDLAKMFGLGISSVSKRLSHLFEENVIRVQAHVDYNKVGYHARAFVLIRAQNNLIESICKTINNFTEVQTVITLINGYDIFLGTVSYDSESLYSLVNQKIAVIPGVHNVEVWVRGKNFKRYFGPLPEK